MKSEGNGLSRRAFLSTAAAVGVGTAASLTGCAPSGSTNSSSGTSEEHANPTNLNGGWPGAEPHTMTVGVPVVEHLTPEETLDCDVLVIGGGASGCCAALRASEEGATVILVEKTSVLGGCYNLSWAACTVGSKYAPVDDPTFGIADPDMHIKNWIANSDWRVDGAAIRQLLMTTGEAYDWLVDKYGLELTPLGWGNGFMMLPDYAGRAEFWKKHVTAATVGRGGKLLLEHTAKSLEKTGDAVTGAIVVDGSGKVIQINARAISISTGGYAGNPEMVFAACGFGGPNYSLPQNIGEGLAIAWEAGAWQPDNFGGQMLHQTLSPATDDLLKDFDQFPAKYPLMLGYLPQLLNVGASGVRFRDEGLAITAVPAANSSSYQGPFHYCIISKKLIDAMEAGGLSGIGFEGQPPMPPEFQPPDYTDTTPWVNAIAVYDKAVELGYAFKGNTPKELATNAGMDEEMFTEQFSNYEKFCAEGVDTEFNKSPELLIPLGSEGPYYAITTEQNSLGSFGGIQTSLKYEALRRDRTKVAGLYATGAECGSNLYNDMYVGDGIGLGNTVTSGYLCGKAMADYARKS